MFMNGDEDSILKVLKAKHITSVCVLCSELYNSNNPNAKSEACEFLYQVITSKKYRTWNKVMEKLMLRFLEICVELRRGKQAKHGLHQYRALTQQIPSSLQTVLKHFLERAREATKYVHPPLLKNNNNNNNNQKLTQEINFLFY
jgi:hypothetical protein